MLMIMILILNMILNINLPKKNLEGDYECPDEYTELGQRGYTPEELIKTLEQL
jgi:hypothetical protein